MLGEALGKMSENSTILPYLCVCVCVCVSLVCIKSIIDSERNRDRFISCFVPECTF